MQAISVHVPLHSFLVESAKVAQGIYGMFFVGSCILYAIEQMINAHGGKCSLKISNATDFLVVGQFKNLPAFYMSAKEVYAEKLISEGGKIKIITPSQLFEMMGEAL